MVWRAASAVLAGLAASLGACRARSECDGITCAAACPRDAARDASGRCACTAGDVLVLGACVSPAVGDGYCGPAARAGIDGCVFRACGDGELLDAATGTCLAKTTLPAGGAIGCDDGETPVVAQGRVACVAAEAVCPRGTHRAGAACTRAPRCPPGTLAADGACQSVVTVGARGDLPRVDLGAWSALVLGADGASGGPDLCRPLALRPDAFGLSPGIAAAVTLRIGITIEVPDQDIARVHAHTQGNLRTAEPLSLSPAAEAVVSGSVATLIEPLRGLGGESSTAVVELEVTCRVSSL